MRTEESTTATVEGSSSGPTRTATRYERTARTGDRTEQDTVVGWDGSPEAAVALEWALRRGNTEDGGLTLLDVEDATAPIPGEVITKRMVDDRRSRVEAEAARVREAHPGLKVTARAVGGDRVDELERMSRPDNLIVVGTGRRRQPRVRYHWSLGARIAARAHGAVAVIPSVAEGPRSMVVVGIDGTEVSLKAARFAAREARRLGEPLEVVHAWLDPLVAAQDIRAEAPLLGEIEEVHRVVIDSVVNSLSRSNPDLVISPLFVRDNASRALRDASASAALLVVGTEQARGIDRFLLGSTAHAMILDIQAPTIVVAPEYVI